MPGYSTDLNHIHLHVRDIPRARLFYERSLGFTQEAVREQGFLIVRNADGFDLALKEDRNPSAMPPWFHFGCRMASRDAVREMHDRMKNEGVPIEKALTDHGSWMSFAATDPDGYTVEVYSE